MTAVELHPTEIAPVDTLRPHPKNYKQHPSDQLDEIASSLTQHGVYRPVVVARDGTILAGHGVVEAARRVGLAELPVIRLDLDPQSPSALKIVVGDNELTRLAVLDERALADLLSEVHDTDPLALLGTGVTEEDLLRLIVLTHDEITEEEAEELWRGMPRFSTGGDERLHVTVNFVDEEARAEFARRLGMSVDQLNARCWWPPRRAQDRDDSIALAYRDA